MQAMKDPPHTPPDSEDASTPPAAHPGGRRRPRTLPSTPRSILDALKQAKSEPEPT